MRKVEKLHLCCHMNIIERLKVLMQLCFATLDTGLLPVCDRPKCITSGRYPRTYNHQHPYLNILWWKTNTLFSRPPRLQNFILFGMFERLSIAKHLVAECELELVSLLYYLPSPETSLKNGDILGCDKRLGIPRCEWIVNRRSTRGRIKNCDAGVLLGIYFKGLIRPYILDWVIITTNAYAFDVGYVFYRRDFALFTLEGHYVSTLGHETIKLR